MSGLNILIIDDEPMVHEILEKYLTVSNYAVHHAYNGKEGIELMESLGPDLVLLDVQMPVMDGFATLSAIRKKEHLGDIPVLMLTSLDKQHLKVKGLELGADDYILKPFDMSELLARIKASLRKTARYKKAEGMLSGNLADVPLAELLQGFEMGAKTAQVDLKDMDAAIFLEEGRLVHIRQGAFAGDKALERIFFMEKGSFAIRFGELPKDMPKSPQPLMSALMGVLANVDEINAILEKLRKKAPQVEVSGSVSDMPGLENIRPPVTMAVENLLVLLGGSLKQNVNTIVAALKEGRFKAAPKAP